MEIRLGKLRLSTEWVGESAASPESPAEMEEAVPHGLRAAAKVRMDFVAHCPDGRVVVTHRKMTEGDLFTHVVVGKLGSMYPSGEFYALDWCRDAVEAEHEMGRRSLAHWRGVQVLPVISVPGAKVRDGRLMKQDGGKP